jgi:hypothetical protein
MKKEVEYPEMRIEVIDAISQLADDNKQRLYWTNHVRAQKDGIHLNFDQIFHTLLDDVPFFLDKLDETLGCYVRNQIEADAVHRVVILLDRLLLRHGPLMTEEQALADRDWPEVVRLAKLAKLELERKFDVPS